MGMENNPIKAINSVDENKCVFVLHKKPLSKPEKLSEEEKKMCLLHSQNSFAIIKNG